MYIFPTLEKQQAALLERYAPDSFSAPCVRHTQEGVFAGAGSQVYLFDESLTAVDRGFGALGLDVRYTIGTLSLNHVECGKCCYVEAYGSIYRATYCKVGDFSKLSFHGPLPRNAQSPHIFVKGKSFCKVIVSGDCNGGDYEKSVPMVYIEGGSFKAHVEILNWCMELSFEKFDETPLHIQIGDCKLPEKLLNTLETSRLDLRYESINHDIARWISRRYTELRNRRKVETDAKGRITA